MNRKLFIKFIKVNVQMMALFFMFIIIKSNTSFAYTNNYINRIDITGNTSEFFETGTPNAPIQGIRVELKDKNTNQPFQTTLTDANGNYILTDIPEGNYSLEYKYGDINVLNEFGNTDLVNGLSKKDILKYNGHDYIVSDTQENRTNTLKKLELDAAQIFFVIDTSNSMNSKMTNLETGESVTRIQVVKEAAKQLAKTILDENEKLNSENEENSEDENELLSELSELNSHNFYIGLISFNSDATDALADYPCNVTKDYDVICEAIDNLQADWDTNVSPAIEAAKTKMISNNKYSNNEDGLKIVIFLSDGLPAQDKYNNEEELEQDVINSFISLKEADIKLYTLLIVGNTLGLNEIENVADLTDTEFEEIIGYNKDAHYPTTEYIEGYSFINNYYYWYPYVGYLRHIYGLYKDFSDRLVFQSSADDLSNCMTENIKSWIDEEVEDYDINHPLLNQQHTDLIEYNLIDDSKPECGWENSNRRIEVDNYFSDTFHNTTSNDPNNLSAQSTLFKILDDPDSFSDSKIKDFSKHTYMTLSFDITIDRTTKTEVFNICLKRRNEFSLKVSNKVIAAKVTLNTGQVVYKKFDESYNYDDINRKPYLFFKDIDSELLHGALIELEYRVYIENLSPNIACTYLDLVSYLPPGLYFSENSTLLSNKYFTNFDTGWNIDQKSDLLEQGYLVHNDFDLINRNYIITYSHPVNIPHGDTFETNFVLSTYVTNVDDFALYREPNEDKDIVEIFGYRNSKNRRMETKDGEETYTTVAGETAKRATFTSIYPGDGDPTAPDYSLDYNYEGINPVTGKKQNYTIYVIYSIIIVLSILLIILKIKLKK